jgi:hypothetical protein
MYEQRAQRQSTTRDRFQEAAAAAVATDQKQNKFKLDSGEQIDIAKQSDLLAMYEQRAQRQSTTRDRFQEAAKTKQERREKERKQDTRDLQQAARSEQAIKKERKETEAEERDYQRALQLSQEESDYQTALKIEEREKQKKRDYEYALRYAQRLKDQYGEGIRIINDRCNATIKNINDSNCNQKLEKIQKIQYGRDQLIEDMNKFFNKKINKLKN